MPHSHTPTPHAPTPPILHHAPTVWLPADQPPPTEPGDIDPVIVCRQDPNVAHPGIFGAVYLNQFRIIEEPDWEDGDDAFFGQLEDRTGFHEDYRHPDFDEYYIPLDHVTHWSPMPAAPEDVPDPLDLAGPLPWSARQKELAPEHHHYAAWMAAEEWVQQRLEAAAIDGTYLDLADLEPLQDMSIVGAFIDVIETMLVMRNQTSVGNPYQTPNP